MNWRTAIAFVVAPPLVPAVLYLYVAVSSSPSELSRVGITHAILIAMAYAIAVLFGIPMHRYLQRRGFVSLRHYLVGGALIGLVPGIAILGTNIYNGLSLGLFPPLLVGALVAVLSSMAFWFIGICSFRHGSNKTIEPTR